MEKRGLFLQTFGAALLLLTTRAVLDAGTVKLIHSIMCLACFAMVLRGASLSAGRLVAVGNERLESWYVFYKHESALTQ